MVVSSVRVCLLLAIERRVAARQMRIQSKPDFRGPDLLGACVCLCLSGANVLDVHFVVANVYFTSTVPTTGLASTCISKHPITECFERVGYLSDFLGCEAAN